MYTACATHTYSLPMHICIHNTQDLGNYSESFYSVQTTKGEAISQLIASYVDVILQKKEPVHREAADDGSHGVGLEGVQSGIIQSADVCRR